MAMLILFRLASVWSVFIIAASTITGAGFTGGRLLRNADRLLIEGELGLGFFFEGRPGFGDAVGDILVEGGGEVVEAGRDEHDLLRAEEACGDGLVEEKLEFTVRACGECHADEVVFAEWDAGLEVGAHLLRLGGASGICWGVGHVWG
jgi:hypothetical protein